MRDATIHIGGRPIGPDTPGLTSRERKLVEEAAAQAAVDEQARPAALRAEYITAIDARAEAVRLRYITAGEGQAMVYLRKGEQAKAWLSDTSQPVPELVQATADGRGMTALEAARLIANTEAMWLAVAADIERARESGKAAVRAAADAAEIIEAGEEALQTLEAL